MSQAVHDIGTIALCQLETALRLYFEGKDYYSVITLAGASEEIFGKLAKTYAILNETALDSLANAVLEIDKTQTRKCVVRRANYMRNRLKHWTEDETTVVECDAPEEAKDMLNRAIDNYYALTRDISPAMRRFQNECTRDEPRSRPSSTLPPS